MSAKGKNDTIQGSEYVLVMWNCERKKMISCFWLHLLSACNEKMCLSRPQLRNIQNFIISHQRTKSICNDLPRNQYVSHILLFYIYKCLCLKQWHCFLTIERISKGKKNNLCKFAKNFRSQRGSFILFSFLVTCRNMQVQRFQANPGNSLCSTDVLKGQLKMLNGQICYFCLTGQDTTKDSNHRNGKDEPQRALCVHKGKHLLKSVVSANPSGHFNYGWHVLHGQKFWGALTGTDRCSDFHNRKCPPVAVSHVLWNTWKTNSLNVSVRWREQISEGLRSAGCRQHEFHPLHGKNIGLRAPAGLLQ